MKIAFICVFLFLIYKCDAIINGHQAPTTPHHVYVFSFATETTGSAGAGSLISSSHVLTTGSNIHQFIRWDLRLGNPIFNLCRQILSNEAVLFTEYNAVTHDNNIGIIILPSPVTFSADIAPISLAPSYLSTPLGLENEEGAVVGFGYTTENSGMAERLQRAFVRIIDDDRCLSNFNVNVTNSFCALNTNSNICRGDIGGGFTIMNERRETLVGINSITLHSCAAEGRPSAYTRITNVYRQWIRSVTNV